MLENDEKIIPAISIIIPVYNVEKYIKRCLDSIINQTFKNIEIILVDDCTKDESGRICDEYARKDKRIKVIHKKENEGLGMARNTGIENAKGEYIAFIDPDDKIDSDFYEKLYESAENNKSDLVLGNIVSIDIKNSYKEITPISQLLNKYVFYKDEVISEVLHGIIGKTGKRVPMSACIGIYKNDIFKKNNIRFFSERELISEDLIFQLDFIPKCNIISIVDNVYYYYYSDNTESLTRRYNKNRFILIKKLHFEVIKRLKEMNIYTLMKDGESSLLISNIRACIKQERMNNRKSALDNIKTICLDREVHSAACNKNIDRTFRQKIFDGLIKYNKYHIIYYIISKI